MRPVWMIALLLGGCGGPLADNAIEIVAAPEAPAPVPTPPTPRAVAPDSAEAAADVVRRYYASIAERRYDDAYRLREPDAAGPSATAFADGFARYADYVATVGAPGDIDAGAGQRYVTIPVRVDATSTSGERVALEGPVILHRAADIDGATPEQRKWRIRSTDLKPRP